MLEPQSTVFLVLLVVVLAALMWWLIVSRRMVLRIIAACLAFIPAMAFGVAAVNKYYDYYQTWGRGHRGCHESRGPGADRALTVSKPSTGSSLLGGRYVDLARAREQGYVLPLKVHGRSSGITRTVYVFLPPQYFWPGYQKYRFPAIELNQAGGPQDANFLARDLPAYIASGLRARRPGAGWGIAGYSEGGFCTANLGLQYGRVFSYAGVLSGYFRPYDNQLAKPSRQVNPFGRDRRLRLRNTPPRRAEGAVSIPTIGRRQIDRARSVRARPAGDHRADRA